MPPNLAWIDPDRQIKQLDVDITREELAGFEVILILDTSAWAQMSHIKDFLEASPAKRIVIDHHVSGDNMNAEMMKNDSAAATGELVAEIVDFFELQWDPKLSVPLYAAVATDTGWYRFPLRDGAHLSFGGQNFWKEGPFLPRFMPASTKMRRLLV